MSKLNMVHGLFVLIGTILAGYSLYLLALNKIHLGILLPLLIGVGFVAYGLYHDSLAHLPPVWQRAWQGFAFLFWAWVVSVFAFFALLIWHNNKATDITGEPVAIIVLGSKATAGVPSPALASRLDAASTFANEYPNAYLVTTGGIGFGESVSEGVSASNYLQSQHHIPAQRILIEDTSTSTELNLANAKPILQAHGIAPNAPMLIVTSDFHTLRTQKIAQKQGLINTTVVPAPTPLLTRYHSWLREYFAFISGYVLREF